MRTAEEAPMMRDHSAEAICGWSQPCCSNNMPACKVGLDITKVGQHRDADNKKKKNPTVWLIVRQGAVSLPFDVCSMGVLEPSYMHLCLDATVPHVIWTISLSVTGS